MTRDDTGSVGKQQQNHGADDRNRILNRAVEVHDSAANEKEISHGRVSWQTHWTYFEMGLLASSIG
jgi:hypothetical protein